MLILGIETSCDETAVSLVEGEGDFAAPRFTVRAHIVASQIAIHAPFGGVVPNLAKREHQNNLPKVLEEAMSKSKVQMSNVDVIAVTRGPGLEPALWAGLTFAEELAKRWGKPLVGVNHLEGHIVAPLATIPNSKTQNPNLSFKFPLIALIVSGGHTELVLVKNWLEYEILGATRDDAAGEAFDKAARLLGLPYPGGPALSKLAAGFKPDGIRSAPRLATPSLAEGSEGASGVNLVVLPRPMINSGDLDFSFSGLKTSLRYLLEKEPNIDKAAVAHEFQQAVIDVLVSKTKQAVEKYNPTSVILTGGVAANSELRRQLKEALPVPLLLPATDLATDNATMIATAGYFRALKKEFGTNLVAEGRLSL
jgi:N6-L-threonylcarbamoyladenine synthase